MKRPSPRLTGLFVIGALALLVGAVAIFGGGRLLAPKETFVLFFEDDVAGLQVGAPVTFRGVRVGAVTDIQIRYDSDHQNFTIPVFVKLERRQVIVAGTQGWEEVDHLVERGLRAQLKMQSFVTAQLVVEMDMDPAAPLRLVGAIDDVPEIPTKRSSISQLRATFDDLMSEVRKVPLDQLAARFISAAEGTVALLTQVEVLVADINRHLNASFEPVPDLVQDTRRMVAEMNAAARDIGQLARDADRNVPAISQGALQAVGRLNKTLQQAEVTLGSVQDAVGDRSPLQFQMTQALTEITAAASALRVLAEYLQQNPGALVSGKGAQ